MGLREVVSWVLRRDTRRLDYGPLNVILYSADAKTTDIGGGGGGQHVRDPFLGDLMING